MDTTSFGLVLQNIAKFSWKEWVYIDATSEIDLNSSCMVLDPDSAEFGDNDIPLVAERIGLSEFLSIQDLRSIELNLQSWKPDYTIEEFCVASSYYFQNDAFLQGK